MIQVEVENRSGLEVDEAAAVALARRVLEGEGVASGELGLAFVAAEESRLLKQKHLGVNEATDALAFPLDALDPLPEGLPRQLGDVVVCPQACVPEGSSGEPAMPGRDEWRQPLVHALLHLVGHDHGATMKAREAVYAA